MNTVLVSGGAGFIGGCFVRRLLKTGSVRIVNLDKLTYASEFADLPPKDERHVFVRGDICDHQQVFNLLQQYQPTWFVNFAAESHVDRSIKDSAPFVETNVNGVHHCLESSLRYWNQLSETSKSKFRFLQISTDEVFGSIEFPLTTLEDAPLQPSSPYAASKASAEHLVRSFNVTYGLPTLITRCGNNFGPRQFHEKLIPLMISKALKRERLPIYGDGQNIRSWIHVEDHCEAVQRILHAGDPGQSYNIGPGVEKTNLELVTQICKILDESNSEPNSYANLIEFVDDRPGHDKRYSLECARLNQEIGWNPKMDFDSSLRNCVNWYQELGQVI